MTPAPIKSTFLSVQAGRGMAASAVVLFHAGEIIRLEKYWHSDIYHRLFAFGSHGVDFFFVLSGFIIMWTHHCDIAKKQAFGNYVFKRIVRIYPPYWIASTLVLIASLAYHVSNDETPLALSSLLSSFALIGRHDTSILPVGWTLFHEMLFYILFGILILSQRIGAPLMAAWFLLCGIGVIQNSYWGSYINVLFLVGMGVFWIIRRVDIPKPGVLVVAGTGIFMTGVLMTSKTYYLTTVYGLASFLILIGIIELERSRNLRIPNFMVFLGNASYAIYLVHFAVISLGAKLLMIVHVDVLIAGPILFAMGIGGGILFHLIVEKPVSKVFRPGWRAIIRGR